MSETPTTLHDETQAATKPAFHLGGQALIEGVMMRSPRFIAASVRRSNGEIETRVERFHSVLEKSKWFRLPLVRGVISLVEMMLVGTRYLRWSSDLIMQDEAAKAEAAKAEVANPLIPEIPSNDSLESSTRTPPRAAFPQDDVAK
ncbi:MAG TPA: DUF1385 domain-containing protein [Abditibacteriaceae bacterium]|jgi:uncharacterized protein YqhQ|nr:DUF1385 domain-containing protein [Abditibacteriaceae bacterium]